MTWTHALTLLVEAIWLFVAAFAVLLAVMRVTRWLWRRWRVHREYAEVDRLSLEAIARFREQEHL